MMGELTASLAHDLKQPITAAITDAKTSLRWLGRDQPDVVGGAATTRPEQRRVPPRSSTVFAPS